MHNISPAQSSILCGTNSTKVPVLQSDSVAVLSGLTDDNIVAVVVQNTLEYDRYGETKYYVMFSFK